MTLNKHAPRKRKTIRENQSPFINKETSKAIMKRTELRHKFLKHTTDESRTEFIKQRNYCVFLPQKLKRNYKSNLNVKDIYSETRIETLDSTPQRNHRRSLVRYLKQKYFIMHTAPSR